MSITRTDLDRIAFAIDARGMSAVEAEVAGVVDHARRTGVRGPAVEVLSDMTEPEPARMRAYGLVASRVVRADAARRVTTAAPDRTLIAAGA